MSPIAFEWKDNLRLEALFGISGSLGVSSGYGTGTVREVFGPVLTCSFSRAHTSSSRTLWKMFTRVLLSPLQPRVEQVGFAEAGGLHLAAHLRGHLRGRGPSGTTAGGTSLSRGPIPSSPTTTFTLHHPVQVPAPTGDSGERTTRTLLWSISLMRFLVVKCLSRHLIQGSQDDGPLGDTRWRGRLHPARFIAMKTRAENTSSSFAVAAYSASRASETIRQDECRAQAKRLDDGCCCWS